VRTKWSITCGSLQGGGVILAVEIQSAAGVLVQEMPFDRDGAVSLAADILQRAGIREALFRDGQVAEL
jgi:hypothetical protein